jgi:hypothetical protein
MGRLGPVHDPCKKGQPMASETHTLNSRSQILIWVGLAIVVLAVVYFTI